MVPSGATEQYDEPSDEYSPGPLHSVQIVPFSDFVPAGQSAKFVRAEFGMLPALAFEHTEAPSREYSPGWEHGVQATPFSDFEPAGQVLIPVWFALGSCPPGAK